MNKHEHDESAPAVTRAHTLLGWISIAHSPVLIAREGMHPNAKKLLRAELEDHAVSVTEDEGVTDIILPLLSKDERSHDFMNGLALKASRIMGVSTGAIQLIQIQELGGSASPSTVIHL